LENGKIRNGQLVITALYPEPLEKTRYSVKQSLKHPQTRNPRKHHGNPRKTTRTPFSTKDPQVSTSYFTSFHQAILKFVSFC